MSAEPICHLCWLAAGGTGWASLLPYAALPVVAYGVARLLRIHELFEWPTLLDDAERLVRVRGRLLQHEGPIAGAGRALGLTEPQSALVTAAIALRTFGADATVTRVMLDEMADCIADQRRRARNVLVVAAMALPALGLLTWLAEPSVLGGSAGAVAIPIALVTYGVVFGAVGLSLLRRGRAADRRIAVDVYAICSLGQGASSASLRRTATARAA